jgi:hypothetical protein
MNIDRLNAVKARILAEPEQFDMGDFVSTKYDERGEPCGTACCIGGHAAVEAGYITLRSTPRPGLPSVMYDMTPAGVLAASGLHYASGANGFGAYAEALDLLPSEANRLFFVENWPKSLRASFEQATSTAARATIAGRRIDHFMRTEGRE